MGTPDHLTCLLKTCLQVKKQQVEPDMEPRTRLKLGKKYNKAVHCHPAYLTICIIYQAKRWAGWITSWNQKCRRNKYQQPQIRRWYHLNGRNEEELNSLLMRDLFLLIMFYEALMNSALMIALFARLFQEVWILWIFHQLFLVWKCCPGPFWCAPTWSGFFCIWSRAILLGSPSTTTWAALESAVDTA